MAKRSEDVHNTFRRRAAILNAVKALGQRQKLFIRVQFLLSLEVRLLHFAFNIALLFSCLHNEVNQFEFTQVCPSKNFVCYIESKRS